MQRTRFFTASRAEIASDAEIASGSDAASALARLPWIPILTTLLVVGAAAWIAAHPNTAVWDQARLLEARFEAPWHPAAPFGFTAQLVVVALRPLASGPDALHTLVRVAAMAFWAGGAMWLATAWLERRALQAALLLVLFTSQYPFLWLSTELIAGGLLCLALGAWIRGVQPWLTGVALALLALGKPDLLLVAVTLLGVFAWQRRDAALQLCAGFGAALAVLPLPGLVAIGPSYLTQYASDRSSGC